jgi:hypothetical protein
VHRKCTRPGSWDFTKRASEEALGLHPSAVLLLLMLLMMMITRCSQKENTQHPKKAKGHAGGSQRPGGVNEKPGGANGVNKNRRGNKSQAAKAAVRKGAPVDRRKRRWVDMS